MGYQLKTPGGYSFGEVISALQKDIRRGNEVNAMFWALELVEKFPKALWTRLRVIANEDIGPANPMVMVYVNSQVQNFDALPKEGSRRLVLANTILLMCRSPKSREADHFQCVVNQRRLQQGFTMEIPDYALDKHTGRGANMGRGWEHWFTDGCKLSPDPTPNQYQEEAESLWPTMKKAQGQVKPSKKASSESESDGDLDLFEHGD